MASTDNLGPVSTRLLTTHLRDHMRRFTPQVRASFLAELSRTGLPSAAATATGMRIDYLRIHKRHDAQFSTEWEAALDYAFDPRNHPDFGKEKQS